MLSQSLTLSAPDPLPLGYGAAFGMSVRFLTRGGDSAVLRLPWRKEEGAEKRKIVADREPVTANRDIIRTAIAHRPTIEKSSNAMTESALVHKPTFPASLNVASFASKTAFPS
jgi:hypothetical protein